MSEVDAVLTAFLSLAGLDEGEKERWQGLCASAWNDLLAHLREGISPSQQGERLTQGAAAIAYYKYALLEAAVGCHSLKAGELSVSCDGDGLLRAAGAIRDDAILSLADLADFSPKVLFEVKP